MKVSGLRLVKDVKKGEQTPYHVAENGSTETLCGENCTGYTYSVHNPEVLRTGVDDLNTSSLCATCYYKFKHNHE